MSNNVDLSASQLNALVITERVNSVVSVLGIFFILLTYGFSHHFNKPINRLIFFAAFSNLGTNIASLISTSGPLAGAASPLCQIQGFLVQMFLGVDAYWSFCMAINVYLAFFRGWTVERLRSLDVRYLLACYGLSFIPALIFIFIETKERGRIYGEAIIWCWTTEKWGFLRILMLYAIVWLAIAFAAIIYTMAMKAIWKKREHLDGFLNPLNDNPFTNVVTTEIEVTSEVRPMTESAGPGGGMELEPVDQYSVNVETETKESKPLPDALRVRSLTRDVAANEANAEACLYARVAILFFVALLITWVPSSVNRVYALAHPDEVNFPLNYVSSFVFPLQGFWNVIVYIITSQTACRHLWEDLFQGNRVTRSRSKNSNLTGGRKVSDRVLGKSRGQRLDSYSLSSLSN